MNKNHKTLYMILAVLLVFFLFFGSREKEVVEEFGMFGGDKDNNDKDGEKEDSGGFKSMIGASSHTLEHIGKDDKISCENYKFSMEKGTGENGEEYGNIIADLTKQVQQLQFGKATEDNCNVVKDLKDEVKKLLNELNRIGT